MSAKDIIREWRMSVDDAVEPFLWSEEEALAFLNEAQDEAVRRGRLLQDSHTVEITQIDLVVGQASYALDPRVLFIRKARIAGKLPLRRMNEQDLATTFPYWEEASPSEPSVFLTDTDTGYIRLHPAPKTAGLLLLTVVRDPLTDIKSEDDEPELNRRYHRSLQHWMSHKAFLKPDTETMDPKRAADALALFELEFGKKSSAIDEAWINREQMEGDGTF